MRQETFAVKLLRDEQLTDVSLHLQNNYTDVILTLTEGERTWRAQSYNCFAALKVLQRQLEEENIQLCCNGTARNVYPAGAFMTRELGRIAYQLQLGERADKKWSVDIYQYNEWLDFTTVELQQQFFRDWLRSVK